MTTATVHSHHFATHPSGHRPDATDTLVDARAMNTPAQRLREAGLRVTSARIVALRLAPIVFATEGQLTPKGLHDASRRCGYTFSLASFWQILQRLDTTELLPCAPTFVRRRRTTRGRYATRLITKTDHVR